MIKYLTLIALVLSVVLTACGPGQFMGPTATALPKSTPVPSATITPSPTPAPTNTATPIPPPTMIRSGTLSGNETWSGIVQVVRDVIVPWGVTLTIEPGTIVRFTHYRENNDQLTIKNYLTWPVPALVVYGTLLAVGSPGHLILFTSDAPDPQTGDWRGIIIMTEYTSKTARPSIISYAIVEYASKSILFTGAAGKGHLVENNIIRFADRTIKLEPGNGGGSGISLEDASTPIIRGNIIYGTLNGIEVTNKGVPVIENNIICFHRQSRPGWGTALRIGPTYPTEAIVRNNLFCGNLWSLEFNWGAKTVVENNLILWNQDGIVVCQDGPKEPESFPVVQYNDLWGNTIDYMQQKLGNKAPVPPGRYGGNNVSIDPHFTEGDFYLANFHFDLPDLKDSGNPEWLDPDGSRSDIGPNWDWSWVTSDLLVPYECHGLNCGDGIP